MDSLLFLKQKLSKETPLLSGRSYLNYNSGASFRKAEGLLNVAVVYPNSYKVGMSSLGFLAVCEEWNKLEGVSVDRFFYEPKCSDLRGLATGRLLRDFNLIVFSLSYELDYFNIEEILKKGGVEPLTNKRTAQIVGFGGVAVSLNPRLVNEYSDIVFIGDAEVLIPRFFKTYTENEFDFSKTSTMLADGNSGYYFSELDNKFKLQKISKILEPFYSPVITKEAVFPDRILIDGGRGCPYNCSFCITGHFLKPYIIVDATSFIPICEKNISDHSIKSFGIISTGLGRINNFKEFLKYAVSKKLDISVSSIRFEDIDEEMVDLLIKVGQRVFTLAPEAGSLDLRVKISKNITNEEIIKKVKLIHKLGGIVKLYFMYGLPSEIDEDLLMILTLIKELRSSGEIRAGIQGFVPKPYTPFANATFVGVKELKRKKDYVLNRAIDFKIPKDIIEFSSVKECVNEWELTYKNFKQ